MCSITTLSLLGLATGEWLQPLPKPAMRLYGIVSPNSGWGGDMGNTWTGDDVEVASALSFVYGGQLSNATARALEEKQVSRVKYKNYGGTSSTEANATEIWNHDSVAYYRPGLLAADIDDRAATITVYRAPHVPHMPQIPWDPEHPGGFKASTSRGDRSTLTANGTVTSYVTWLRVGDEYMKVVAAKKGGARSKISPDVVAVLTVERGFWGSAAAPHSLNETVLAPIYHATGSYPGGSKGVIRYALDPSAPYTAEYVAAAYTSPDVLDGLWMDCFGSQPFRAEDAWGNIVGMFMVNASDKEKKRYERSGYVQAQRVLVERVRGLLAKQGATRLYANNVDTWIDAPTLLKPGTLLDGGAYEAFIGSGDGPCGFQGKWSDWDEAKWRTIAANLMNVSLGGFAVMPMIGSAGCESPQLAAVEPDARAVVETFAYASFLLVAGTRNQLLGVVPYRFRDQAKGESGGLEMWLDSMYHWPIGKPVTTGKVLDDYQVSDCTLARRFETALVLVNPTTNCTDKSLQLNGTWFDPTAADPNKAVTTVQVLPDHGIILLSAPLQAVVTPSL